MIKLTAKRDKWFVLPQDASGQTKVKILHLKPGEVSDIEAEVNQIVGKQEGEKFVTEVGFDLAARSRAIIRKVIIGWEGFQDENGKEMKCTDFNKVKVLREFDWFFDQIEAFRNELAEEAEAEEEGAEKN